MSAAAPPPPTDELELLSREARALQRKRLLGILSAVALIAGATIAVDAIASGGSSGAVRGDRSTGFLRSRVTGRREFA